MPHKDVRPPELTPNEIAALTELEAAEAADAALRERNVVSPTSKGMLERMDIGECPDAIQSEQSTNEAYLP